MLSFPEVIVKPTLIFEEKIGRNEVKIQSEKVGDILQKFVLMFKDSLEELKAVSTENPAKLHPSILILLNGRNIRFLQGEETRVKDGDILMIIPPIIGG